MKMKVLESALAAAGGWRASRTLLDSQLGSTKSDEEERQVHTLVKHREARGGGRSGHVRCGNTSITIIINRITSHLTTHVGKIKYDFSTLH